MAGDGEREERREEWREGGTGKEIWRYSAADFEDGEVGLAKEYRIGSL